MAKAASGRCCARRNGVAVRRHGDVCRLKPSENAPKFGSWGIDLSAMDKSVKPGDDFFMYVNGTWYRSAIIPPDRVSTGVSDDIEIRTENRLKGIIAALAAKPYDSLSTDEKKLRDLYDAYVDQKTIDAAGLTPAKSDLDFIAGLKTLDDVASAMGRPDLGLDGPLSLDIDADLKDSNRYVVTADQSGLPMNCDYYLKDDKALATVREAYKKHLAQMLTLAGFDDADKRAAAVYDLEYKLAQAQWSDAENRNVDKVYNPMSFTQLKALAPQFPWNSYIKARGISQSGPSGERQVIVEQLSAFPKIAQIFAATPVPVWRDYLAVHYLDDQAAYLPKTFDDAKLRVFWNGDVGKLATAPPRNPCVILSRRPDGFCSRKALCRQIFSPRSSGQNRCAGQ